MENVWTSSTVVVGIGTAVVAIESPVVIEFDDRGVGQGSGDGGHGTLLQ